MTVDIEPNPGRLGRVHMPDERDHLFALRRAPVPVTLQYKYWLSLGAPLDQGETSQCHDDQTEVLTPRGFVLFADLQSDDLLACVDPETADLHFHKPDRVIRTPYVGPLVSAQKQTLNFRVTPDHRMLVRRWDEAKRTLSDEYQFVAAAEMGWYCGLMSRVKYSGTQAAGETMEIAGVPGAKFRFQREPKVVPTRTWLRFLGLFVAEGTAYRAAGAWRVQIAATKERERSFARELLSDLGVRVYDKTHDRFQFEDVRIWHELQRLGLAGTRAPFKRAPSFLMGLSANLIREFLLGHFMGDGSNNNGTQIHITSSSGLASDLQTLIFLSGNEASCRVKRDRMEIGSVASVVNGHPVRHNHPSYTVSVCHRKNLSIECKKDITLQMYAGEVFCAQMPVYKTLVTRREGCILISGNCVAYATTKYLTTHPIINKPWMSPADLYRECQRNDQWPGEEPAYEGTSVRAAMKVLQREGAVKEYLWAWDVETVVSHLLMTGPMVLGSNWHRGMWLADKHGFIWPTGAIDGGHAYLAIGANRLKACPDGTIGAIRILNSWGPSWSSNGRAWLSFTSLQKLLDDDGEAALAIEIKRAA